jgi:hypothetical protein
MIRISRRIQQVTNPDDSGGGGVTTGSGGDNVNPTPSDSELQNIIQLYANALDELNSSAIIAQPFLQSGE